MRSFILLATATLLFLTVANPIGNCECEPPICILSLDGECKCKNAAAQACYDDYLSHGIQCPKPTIQDCSTIEPVAVRAPVPVPTPTGPINRHPHCECEAPICPMELVAECNCKNEAAIECYNGKVEQGFVCPKPTLLPCPTYEGIVPRATVTPPSTKPAKCHCESPICPLELTAECKCKNAAAQACYSAHLSDGTVCASPTPTSCGSYSILARATPPPEGGKFCGGIAGIPCADGYECVDIPKDGCDPKNGGSDCGGVCVLKGEEIKCGGKMGLQCPKGYECVDDKQDSCDPDTGGKDCLGVCEVFSPAV